MPKTSPPLTPPFHAEVRRHGGVPTIFVNDQPVHLGAVGVNCQAQRDIAFLQAEPSSLCMLWIPALCRPDDAPDYEAIARPFEDILARFPETLLMTVIEVRAHAAWAARHPHEMTVYDPPVNDWTKVRPGRHPDPSWASTLWQQYSADYYRQVSAFLHRRFAGRVILYHIGGGSNGENFPIVDPLHYGLWQCGDYSRPMQRWFRACLREYYHDDVALLRAAWSQPELTFETAPVPDRAARLASEWYSFRSPRQAQTADYYRAWSQAVEACSLAWARGIKEGTEGHALVACPIGSVLDFGINAFNVHHMVKNTFSRCLDSPDIDLFQSPASYINRDLGFGDSSAMIPQGTLHRAGKLWLRDFDSRTSLIGTNLAKDPPSALWRNPRDPWEDVQLLKRDAGYSLIKGGAWFWQEHRAGMYRLPEHVNIARRIEQVGRQLLHVDRRPAAGMAVLTDSRSNFHLANSNRLIYAMNYSARLRHWSHAGVAAEVYELDDIAHENFPPHKMLMVTNAFAITDAQVQRIRDHVRRHKGLVIWLVAPGLLTSHESDLQRVSALTGFTIRAVNAEASPQLTMLPGAHPWSRIPTADGSMLAKFGAGPLGHDDSGATAVGPLFYADCRHDPQATVLALSDALAEPGLVAREMDGYTSVYCAAPYLHYALLAQMAHDTGVHRYAPPGDLVHANNSLLLVNAISAGERTFLWPHEVDCIRELYSGQTLARHTRRWIVNLPAFATGFYFAGSWA